MRLLPLLAILLVILCFWQFLPFVVILLGIGLALAIGGILLGAAMNAGAKKMRGKT